MVWNNGWKSCLVQGLGHVYIELRVIGQEVLYMGQNYFHCWFHLPLTTQKQTLCYQTAPISCKKLGITQIKSYFIIGSGSFICYLGTLITNLQIFYFRMGVTKLAGLSREIFSKSCHFLLGCTESPKKTNNPFKGFQFLHVKGSKVV